MKHGVQKYEKRVRKNLKQNTIWNKNMVDIIILLILSISIIGNILIETSFGLIE